MVDHEMLQDKPHRTVVRVGDTVRRPLQPWSSSVHELLLHLENIGYPYAPRFFGIDDEGREVVSYIDGESGGAGWAKVVGDDGLIAMARLLREYHDAVRGFRPLAVDGWAGLTAPHQADDGSTPAAPQQVDGEAGHTASQQVDGEADHTASQQQADGGTGHASPHQADELICHGDFGPWNLVWHGPRPVAVLDWDYAWPARPVHDVAYALEYVAPFRDDEACVRWLSFPGPPDRRHRLEVFAEAYGLDSIDGLVDEVIAQQEAVWTRARLLADQGCQPQAEWQATGFLDTTADRIRWSRDNRRLFESAGTT